MKNLILLFVSLLYLQSCDTQKVNFFQLDENGELSEYQSEVIVESDEFQTYFKLRIDFLDYVKSSLERKFSVDELTEISMKALNVEEDKYFYEAIFSGYTEGETYINKLISAHKDLYEAFPVLKDIEVDGKFMSEDYEHYLYVSIDKNWRSGQVQVRNSASGKDINSSQNGSEIVCGSYWQQVKLLACAGICGGATVGTAAALCGWGCWCMLCTKNSAVADAIC